jgi:hypothetical protein
MSVRATKCLIQLRTVDYVEGIEMISVDWEREKIKLPRLIWMRSRPWDFQGHQQRREGHLLLKQSPVLDTP